LAAPGASHDLSGLYQPLDRANQALGRLDGLTTLLPDTRLFLYLYVRKEALDLLQCVRTEGVWEEWIEFFLEGTETTARQAAETAIQILHLFEADRKKIRAMGRKAASSLAVHEYLQAHPLTKIGLAAKDLKISIPTVTSALETLTKLKIAKELTGKRRDRLFAYPRYLHILTEGTEPLRS
jgi:Fic family protein